MSHSETRRLENLCQYSTFNPNDTRTRITQITKKTMKAKKSLNCSKVLQLMDKDYTYTEAINIVLKDKQVNKKRLEKELERYI